MKGGKPWAVCPTITTGPHKKTFVYLHNGKGHCRLGTLSRSSRYRISYVETSGKNCILVTCVCRCINIWDCALRTDHHHQIEQLKVLALLRVPPLTQLGWFLYNNGEADFRKRRKEKSGMQSFRFRLWRNCAGPAAAAGGRPFLKFFFPTHALPFYKLPINNEADPELQATSRGAKYL